MDHRASRKPAAIERREPHRSTNAAARLERTQFKGDPDPGCSSTSRFLLVVDDPERVREQAIRAGAMELAPVGEEHAWCLGRALIPFGHAWEIGTPTGPWPPQ